MKDDINSHFFLYELALKEGMSAKTLSGRLRTLGYTGSLRGLLHPELARHFRQLLHPYDISPLPSQATPAEKNRKEQKRTEKNRKERMTFNLVNF